jgi:predicted PurR-regulated permease PerM
LRFSWRDRQAAKGKAPRPEAPPEPLDAKTLGSVFAPPRWLRDLGLLSWIIVGILAVLAGVIILLGLLSTIVMPVLAAGIVAAVAAPIVARLQQHRVPRAAGAGIVLLGFFAFAILIFLLVASGIVANKAQIQDFASQALDTVEGWAKDAGASGTSEPKQDISQAVQGMGSKLLEGFAGAIQGLTSLAFFLSFTFFSLFFLLKDGPTIKRFIDGHLGIPRPVAAIITGNVVRSMRRYFFGVTIVAAFNAVVVGLAALILDVPLVGSIMVVTFVTAYIPFIGAFVSGTYAVVIALASQGTTVAILMLIAVVLANGILQQIVQPIAFGATLDLNPLAVLIVTISGGALLGMVGLVLAAPLTSAIIHISNDIARARAAGEVEPSPGMAAAEPEPSPP